jgi:CHASE3 domain sensor protein
MFLADSSTTSSITAAVVSLVGGVGGVLAGAVSALRARTSALRAERNVQVALASDDPSQRALAERLEKLADSMRESAEQAQEASTELDAQAKLARRLQQDADSARELAALRNAQVDAIRQVLGQELDSSRKLIRRDTILVGIFFFIAGVGATLAVTLFVHPFH